MTKWVYGFGGGRADGSSKMKALLGGKGANLAEMSSLGLPVPPGFTITTEICVQYLSEGAQFSDALKAEIEDLYVVYHFDADIAGLRYGKTPGVVLERMNPSAVTVMDRLAELPPVAHPLVFTQEETGRKVLNFSPWFSLGIEGMDRAASDRILGEVLNVLIDEDNAYFHEWRPGDMVLWDNWRIVHSATGIPAEQRRHMQRTTIEGDYGLGRPSTWAEQLEQA